MEQSAISNASTEFDEDFLEWEERDESVPYLAHCIGTSLLSLPFL